MNCKYKIGDALLSITMWLCLLALNVFNAIQHHAGWWGGVGFLLVVFVAGIVLNRNEREREEIQAVRAQRQIALGVPPDEPV